MNAGERVNMIIVSTIKDYFNWLDAILHETKDMFCVSNIKIHHCRNSFYYRGQACKDWGLLPGIFRISSKEYASYEHNVLNKAEKLLWRELSSCSSYLEKMIFLQHYGMKTRLLDVTYNPLVALYFACADKSSSADGIVYAGNRSDLYDDSIAELTAEIAFKYSANDIESAITNYVRKRELNIQYDTFTKPIFINPPMNNPRLEHQNGAFIMSPLISATSNNKVVPNHESLDNEDVFIEKKAIIPFDRKDEILYELSILGINEGTIYQGIPEKIHSIMQEECWKYKYPMLMDMREIF